MLWEIETKSKGTLVAVTTKSSSMPTVAIKSSSIGKLVNFPSGTKEELVRFIKFMCPYYWEEDTMGTLRYKPDDVKDLVATYLSLSLVLSEIKPFIKYILDSDSKDNYSRPFIEILVLADKDLNKANRLIVDTYSLINEELACTTKDIDNKYVGDILRRYGIEELFRDSYLNFLGEHNEVVEDISYDLTELFNVINKKFGIYDNIQEHFERLLRKQSADGDDLEMLSVIAEALPEVEGREDWIKLEREIRGLASK